MSKLSTLFELLAADARRRVLYMLCERGTLRVPDGLQMRSQAGVRHARSDGALQRAPPDSQPHRSSEVQLYHTHLPKLEAEGVIEWDHDSQTVSRGPAFEEYEPALGVLAANATSLPGELF